MYTHISIQIYITILRHWLKIHTSRSPLHTREEGAGHLHFFFLVFEEEGEKAPLPLLNQVALPPQQQRALLSAAR